MRLSAELSLYPLHADFREIVLAFIEELVREGDISAVTNTMSTQIHGEASAVFAAVQRGLEASHARFGHQVLVAKFLPEHQVLVPPPNPA
jgi:uncharacterized protein YqgV (UPF0045/DUF77 family)